MAAPLPPPGGPQVPHTFTMPPQLVKASNSRWSALGSSLVILAFSLRLLGDKYEHQVRASQRPRCVAAPRGGADAASRRATLVPLRLPRDAGGAGGAEGGAGRGAR